MGDNPASFNNGDNYLSIHENILKLFNIYKEYIQFSLHDEYYTICLEFILNNNFNKEYFELLFNNNFFNDLIDLNEKIKIIIDKDVYNSQISFNINNLLNFFKNYSKKYENDLCINCQHVVKNFTCTNCGFKQSNEIFLEENHKKNYTTFVAKIKKHNPNKHCEMWLLQLQGKESVNITSQELHKILKLSAEYYQLNPFIKLSCCLIRKMLKQLHLTIFNSHIVWIKKQIAEHLEIKIDSTELTDDEIDEILNYFQNISTVYIELSHDPKILSVLKKKIICNNLYYPFYLKKILEFVITDKDRLSNFLINIHLQNGPTIKKNNFIWYNICQKLNYPYIQTEF
jgi:hypothetical protein